VVEQARHVVQRLAGWIDLAGVASPRLRRAGRWDDRVGVPGDLLVGEAQRRRRLVDATEDR
jgi:hypothetical protein